MTGRTGIWTEEATMRRVAFALGIVLATGVAHAGTLSFQVTNATDGTVTKTYNNFSDAEMTRWIAANQSDCNAQKNGICTRSQVLNYIMTNFVKGQIAQVKDFEQNAARAQAEAGVTPINPQ